MPLLSVDPLIIHRGGGKLDLPGFMQEAGERLLLLGPSGCGKTSMLSAIAGMLAPGSGRIVFQGQDLYALGAGARDILRGRSIGFVFQSFHLLPALTLRQNILLARGFTGGAGDKDAQSRAARIMERLEIASLADRKPAQMSQGEMQRGAIARALYNQPSLLIADEPTSALDDRNAGIVADLLVEQARDTGAALLVATHDARIKDRFETILHLGEGVAA